MSKKLAPQKYKVSIFWTNEGDFRGTSEKTNNRQNTAMNFQNAQILMVHCLEGRETYQKVESVSKSDEK
jgi:hypothetical protein